MSINELFEFDRLIIRTEFDARFSEYKVEEINEERQKDIKQLLEKVREEKFVEIENHYPSNLIKKVYKYTKNPDNLHLEFHGNFFESDNYYLMYLYYFRREDYDGEIFILGVLINRKNNERLCIGHIDDCNGDGFSVITDSFNYHIYVEHYIEKQIDRDNMLLDKEDIKSPEELLDKMSYTFKFYMN